MRSYLSYDNRRGNTYGAGLKNGSDVHTRGWRAGVNVTVRYAGPGGTLSRSCTTRISRTTRPGSRA